MAMKKVLVPFKYLNYYRTLESGAVRQLQKDIELLRTGGASQNAIVEQITTSDWQEDFVRWLVAMHSDQRSDKSVAYSPASFELKDYKSIKDVEFIFYVVLFVSLFLFIIGLIQVMFDRSPSIYGTPSLLGEIPVLLSIVGFIYSVPRFWRASALDRIGNIKLIFRRKDN